MKKSKNNAGFTLVELIVVIAIMAILAGVGTVAYSGYIKSANKKADMTLVGNIMRAVETGTNSTMFVNDDSFKLGEISYPVGVITLTKDGTNVMTSATAKKVATAPEPCVFKKAENVTCITKKTVTLQCDGLAGFCFGSASTDLYTVQKMDEVYYCTTHSELNEAKELSPLSAPETYPTEAKCEKNRTHANHKATITNQVTCNAGEYVIDVKDKVFLQKETNMCEYAYAQNIGFEGGSSVVSTKDNNDAAVNTPLYQSIIAAFGNTTDLKLKYNGWAQDEPIDVATFYVSAPTLMEDVETLSGMLSYATQEPTLVNNAFKLIGKEGYDLGVSKTYNDSEEVLEAVSDNIVKVYPTKESFITAWMKDNMHWHDENFGLSGRENYSAVRMGYNSGFASYMEANGYAKDVANIVRYYNHTEVELGDKILGLPALVSDNAFTNGGLGDKFKNKIEGFTDDDVTKVKKLFTEYKTSEACKKNGEALYDMMATFKETSNVANIYTSQNEGKTIYDYYNQYVNEMSTMYKEALTDSKDGIVILVTVNDGELDFIVSPSSANPRKK